VQLNFASTGIIGNIPQDLHDWDFDTIACRQYSFVRRWARGVCAPGCWITW